MGISLRLPTGSGAVRAVQNSTYIPTYMMGMPTPEQQAYSSHRENEEQARQAIYLRAREYYDGIQGTKLTERLRKVLSTHGGEDGEVNINLCRVIVDALRDRLKLTGVDTGEDKALAEILWQWWRDNRMDGKQGIIFTAAIRDGDAYVLVEWNNEEQRPDFVFELACAGGEGVKVHYSEERRDKIAYATKRWKIHSGSTVMRRLNVYFPDHIEKYIGTSESNEADWLPYIEDNSPPRPGLMGPCGWHDWLDKAGAPLGVPVVHFKNRDQGYQHGTSELMPVFPIQDGVNKVFVDMMTESDYAAFRIIHASGQGWNSLSVYPGAVLHSEDPNAKLSAISAESPAGLIAIKDSLTLDAARVTQTPGSNFQLTAERPSADTLKQEESGLVSKALKCQTDFGNGIEEMFKIGRRQHNAFSSGPMLNEKQRIESQWKDPQTRNEAELIEILEGKKRLGVSDDQLWLEMGYNADEIRKFQREKVRKEQQALRAQLNVLALPPGQPTGAQNGTTEQQQPAGAGGQPAGATAKAA